MAIAGPSLAGNDSPASAASPASAVSTLPVTRAQPRPLQVPKVVGRLDASQLGLVINTADPYSIEVGEYYAKRRRLGGAQILRMDLPMNEQLTPIEFEVLRERIERQFGPEIQAVALAWNAPWAVDCNSLTGALTLGLDKALCQQSCGRTRPSAYFNSRSARPWTDHGMRLSMLLAAGTVEQGKALVDRGLASEGSLGLRGAPAVTALFVTSDDLARNVRSILYPPQSISSRGGVDIEVIPIRALQSRQNLVMVQAGSAKIPALETLGWVPGALADHLTSFGGVLSYRHGQTMAIDWIRSGVTATYGIVSEPCNHLQKFPHPQALLLHYLQGQTAVEAYWKSVLWPQQGLFVGDPLAAPFSRAR